MCWRIMGPWRLQKCDNPLPVKSKMADRAQMTFSTCNNSAADLFDFAEIWYVDTLSSAQVAEMLNF